jgi:hypothetical protein
VVDFFAMEVPWWVGVRCLKGRSYFFNFW